MNRINRVIWEDLEQITVAASNDLKFIVNSHLILTGASGFVGTWLTLSYLYARKQFDGQGEIVLSCRNPEPLIELLKEAGFNSGYQILRSDVRSFPAGVISDHSLLVHAATPARASLNSQNPLEMFDIIVEGQRRLLELASERSSVRFLFLSSGAVYGLQPADLLEVDETWLGAPDITNPNNSYHEGKRVAELLGATFSKNSSIQFMSARLFAFLAPFLPLQEHFAAGNFMNDALARRPIQLQSGGGSVRTYQYATDLCACLWAILQRGKKNDIFNVGSNESITIKELALRIAEITNMPENVRVLGIDTESNVNRYVPCIKKIQSELQISNLVKTNQAIDRTYEWLSLASK